MDCKLPQLVNFYLRDATRSEIFRIRKVRNLLLLFPSFLGCDLMRIQLAVLAALTGFVGGAFFVDNGWSQAQESFRGGSEQSGKETGQEVIEFPEQAVNSAGVQVGLVNGTQVEQQAYASLDRQVSFTFIVTPLEEVVANISHTLGIPILVDGEALENIGLTPEMNVSIDLKKVPLRSFLDIMLSRFDLTYTIDGVMAITTQEAAEEKIRVRMYRLPGKLNKKSEKIMNALQEVVAVDSWSAVGGPSVVVGVGDILIVSTTTCVHLKVEGFLNTLVAMHGSAEVGSEGVGSEGSAGGSQ